MSNVNYYLRRALSMPPTQLAHAIGSRARHKAIGVFNRQKDNWRSTYPASNITQPFGLRSFLSDIPVNLLGPHSELIRDLSDLYLRNYFDLLGSGWTQVSLKSIRDFHVNSANIAESTRIRSLISADYRPIDWQLDFKSGFRWNESTWYNDIQYGDIAGADVKVPWELSRMQHLPQFAWAYALAIKGFKDFRKPTDYTQAFRDQTLDFISSNPSRYGVNWRCTMDVAIRISNWLFAWDLFKKAGANFDQTFEKEFIRSVYAHGKHIYENLEWHPDFRSNHYLANIAGLIFVGAYLNHSSVAQSWFDFGVTELKKEVPLQFNEDGSNFEASTSYHRLSGEMALWATAIALAHDRKIKFDDAYLLRLERMADFSVAITKPTGEVVQIGDNDSGRFLKIMPPFQRNTNGKCEWEENFLDHSSFIGSVAGIFDREDLAKYAHKSPIDFYFMSGIIGSRFARTNKSRENTIDQTGEVNQPIKESKCRETILDLPNSANNVKIDSFSFPDFGIYIYRCACFFLSIRCGSYGQKGNGGHAHNDQLSIEAQIDGKDLFTDPGTFLYTPDPSVRNRYRSVEAHFAPYPGFEPFSMNEGLFRLPGQSGTCLHFSTNCFLGYYETGGTKIFRSVRIEARKITIRDWSNPPGEIKIGGKNIQFSPGYGRLRKT